MPNWFSSTKGSALETFTQETLNELGKLFLDVYSFRCIWNNNAF